jgi:hypothetical protein
MNPMDAKKKIVIAMVGLGAAARLVPHPWNFTPITAIGLYAGTKSTHLRTGMVAVVLALLLSDAFLGFYSGMWYVYAASLVPVLIGRFVRQRTGWRPMAASALCSGLSFFLTTNFAVWATGHLYAHTATGFAACFAAAVPFYGNQVLGDAFYTTALFGGHVLAGHIVRPAPRTA